MRESERGETDRRRRWTGVEVEEQAAAAKWSLLCSSPTWDSAQSYTHLSYPPIASLLLSYGSALEPPQPQKEHTWHFFFPFLLFFVQEKKKAQHRDIRVIHVSFLVDHHYKHINSISLALQWLYCADTYSASPLLSF